MEYLIISFAALFTSALTLFSGFGLGTLLLPAFAIFFPIQTAVAMTAIVHFLNNIFKLFLLGKFARRDVVLRFGLPGIVSAFLGAWILLFFTDLPPLATYELFNTIFTVMPVNLLISALMILFAFAEISERLKNISFSPKLLPLGGVLSGFFGGLSGHQGALRSAFLLRYGLSKESYIATGIVIACMVDISRLSVYSARFSLIFLPENISILVIAVLSAFTGAFVGNKLVKKITMRRIQKLVAGMLFTLAILIGAGII